MGCCKGNFNREQPRGRANLGPRGPPPYNNPSWLGLLQGGQDKQFGPRGPVDLGCCKRDFSREDEQMRGRETLTTTQVIGETNQEQLRERTSLRPRARLTTTHVNLGCFNGKTNQEKPRRRAKLAPEPQLTTTYLTSWNTREQVLGIALSQYTEHLDWPLRPQTSITNLPHQSTWKCFKQLAHEQIWAPKHSWRFVQKNMYQLNQGFCVNSPTVETSQRNWSFRSSSLIFEYLIWRSVQILQDKLLELTTMYF